MAASQKEISIGAEYPFSDFYVFQYLLQDVHFIIHFRTLILIFRRKYRTYNTDNLLENLKRGFFKYLLQNIHFDFFQKTDI